MTKTLQQAALEMAQSMIETMRSEDDRQLGPDAIPIVVEQVLGLPHLKSLTTDDRIALIRELEARYEVWIGKATVLVDNGDHEAWLTPERRKDWRLWGRYRQYLERGWSMVAVDALDESTNRILGLLEDPRRPGQWDRRGMVVGHVQSGKTSSYTGLICKAVDAGYKVVVVLAGIHNNLRSQTQMRLDEGFLGYETSERDVGGRKQAHIIGVGEIDPDPGIRPDYITTRHDKGDFTLTRGKNFGINPGGNPLLFVIKKNASVLRNLQKWIDRFL
ncbi:MAG: endonuclease, partial [Hyphomicrobium sp.]